MDKSQPPEVDLASISQLVTAARTGDATAHSEICRQVQPQLNRMANQQLDQQLRRKLNPSDIVQATMARMVQGFEDFRGTSSAEFYGWLNTILRNEVHTTRRNLQRDRRDIRREQEPNLSTDYAAGTVADNQQTPEQAVQRNETLTRFRQVIQRLPDDYAEVIELRSIQELTFAEVAARMNRSEDAASKLWGRALVKLQQELARVDDSFS